MKKLLTMDPATISSVTMPMTKIADGNYTLTITVSAMKSNWSDKKRNEYGSKGYMVKTTKICIL